MATSLTIVGFFLITSICAESITAKEQRASQPHGTQADFDPKKISTHFFYKSFLGPIPNTIFQKEISESSIKNFLNDFLET